VYLKESIKHGVTYTMGFAEWEAAVAAGATLSDLERWDAGGFPREFKARVLAWHKLHGLIEAHVAAAGRKKGT
jgi:hypothetical protein